MIRQIVLLCALGFGFSVGNAVAGTDTGFAQQFGKAMCRGYKKMVVQLAGKSGTYGVPNGEIRQVFSHEQDPALRHFLTQVMNQMIDQPFAGQQYLDSGQFMQDCVPLMAQKYHNLNAGPHYVKPTTAAESNAPSQADQYNTGSDQSLSSDLITSTPVPNRR